MALKLEDWIKTSVAKMDNLAPQSIFYKAFFRDSCRPSFINPRNFYSPADGLIIYQKIVKPYDTMVDIKGQPYTLSDAMMDDDLDEDQEYFVIGIFMTLYDVHVNRMPYSGYLSYKELPSIESNNLPMIFMEKDVFKGQVDFDNRDYTYMFNNSRMVNTVYSPKLDLRYHMIQIADDDVNVIMPFSTRQKNFYQQNNRFSFVRWGSEVVLAVEKHKELEMDFVHKPLMHVTAGVDKLIRITNYDEAVNPHDDEDFEDEEGFEGE